MSNNDSGNCWQSVIGPWCRLNQPDWLGCPIAPSQAFDFKSTFNILIGCNCGFFQWHSNELIFVKLYRPINKQSWKQLVGLFIERSSLRRAIYFNWRSFKVLAGERSSLEIRSRTIANRLAVRQLENLNFTTSNEKLTLKQV